MPTFKPTVSTTPIPMSMIPSFIEVAQTGYFTDTTPGGGGAKHPGGALLCAIWGADGTTTYPVDTGNGVAWMLPTTADELEDSQSALVVVNLTDFTLTKADYYSDGGSFLTVPQEQGTDATGKLTTLPNQISGMQDIGGIQCAMAGGWIQDEASIFFGSGGAFSFTVNDPAQTSTIAIGFGVSVNRGCNMGIWAALPNATDVETFYKTACIKVKPLTSTMTYGSRVKMMMCSFGSVNPIRDDTGIFIVLVAPLGSALF